MKNTLWITFLKGVVAAAYILIISFNMIFFCEYVEQFFDWMGYPVMEYFIPGVIYVSVLLLEISIFIRALWFAVQGAAVITSLTMPHSSSAGGNDNIERMRAYRDSKMQNMNNDDAAVFMRDTAWLDGLNGGGSRTGQVRGYINSKLTNMSNETAMDWIVQRGR